MKMSMDSLLGKLVNERLAEPTLWIVDENLDSDSLLCAQARPDLHIISNRFDIAAALSGNGHSVTLCDFDFSLLPVSHYARIVYRVSKERMLVHHCINESYRHLQAGGQLHLLGAKDDGIKTHGRNAERVFGKSGGVKKHGTLYQANLTRPEADSPAQWLDSNDYSQLRTCEAGGMPFISKPGIFGWNKLDRGSVLLAEQALAVLSGATLTQASPSDAASRAPTSGGLGSVLDLGCGYGYLLLATAGLPFSSRTATDNNAAAVTAAEANFDQRELAVTVTLDDCGAQLQEQFDVILCNPPFHHGFSTSGDLSQKFIDSIRRLLRSTGVALLVVNQFIAVERLAAGQFARVETLVSADGFKVVALS